MVVVPARLVWTLISYLAGVVFCACSVRGPWPSRRLYLPDANDDCGAAALPMPRRWRWRELGAGQGLHEVGEWSGPPESQVKCALAGGLT